MLVGGEEIAKNEDRAMNFVVVNAARSIARTFYGSPYVEGQISNPDCYSTDGKVPAANSTAPQSSNCATCPKNIAGSGQGDSKACRYMQRIAVVLEGDLTGNVYRLQLPALSIFGKPTGEQMPFQAYARFLAGHNAPLSGVVTEARFDTTQKVPVLKFRAIRPLNQDEWNVSKQQGQSEDATQAVEVNFTATASKSAPALPAAFKGVEMPKEEDDTPKKRGGAKPAEAPPSKDVDAILAQWGDSDDE